MRGLVSRIHVFPFGCFPSPTPPGRPAPTDPRSNFSFVMRGLVPRIHAFPLGCFPPLSRQAGPRLHVALDRRSNFTSPPSRGRRQGEGVFGRARVPGWCRNSARAGARCRRSRPAVSPCVEYRRSGKRELATPTPTRWDNDQTAGRVIPQASQPCAGRRNRSFQTANGSPAGRLGFGRGTTTA
jgi:hypothetical protein